MFFHSIFSFRMVAARQRHRRPASANSLPMGGRHVDVEHQPFRIDFLVATQ
jgi:hypothetical protein